MIAIWQPSGLQNSTHVLTYLQVVPAQFAFVVHTANPLTGERGELFGEAVVGMGEALVGNFPGRALSFTAPSTAGGQVSPPLARCAAASTVWHEPARWLLELSSDVARCIRLAGVMHHMHSHGWCHSRVP